eukprot:6194855-Pleurochrysis_carterae.AAC.1
MELRRAVGPSDQLGPRATLERLFGTRICKSSGGAAGPREVWGAQCKRTGRHWLSYLGTPLVIRRLFLCLDTGQIGRQRLSAVRDDRCGYQFVVDWAPVGDRTIACQSRQCWCRRLFCTMHVGSWCALRARFTARGVALRTPCSLSLAQTKVVQVKIGGRAPKDGVFRRRRSLHALSRSLRRFFLQLFAQIIIYG